MLGKQSGSSWKESLNSDGQQFHQYKKTKINHLSPQIIEHYWYYTTAYSTGNHWTLLVLYYGIQHWKSLNITGIILRHTALEIQVLAWDSHKIVAELNWLMGYLPSSS